MSSFDLANGRPKAHAPLPFVKQGQPDGPSKMIELSGHPSLVTNHSIQTP